MTDVQDQFGLLRSFLADRARARSGDRRMEDAMSAPVRIQRRRTKGWTTPAGAVYVGRPTKWGNPFRVGSPGPDDCMVCSTREEAIANYRSELTTFANTVNFTGTTLDELQRELRGKNLVCWCRLDQTCHADVLLELANR